MANIIIRNLPDEIHRAIKVRAAQHGRSTEAEVRDMLAQTIQSGSRLQVGTELRRYAEQFGGVELDIRRDQKPIEPATFE